jgi:hypothetical protein
MTREYNMSDIKSLMDDDLRMLEAKDGEYGRSWRKRGGHSAAENVMRKIDRLTTQLEKHNWDIFAAILTKGNTEGLLDTIHDLRGYLYLVEAHLSASGQLESKLIPTYKSNAELRGNPPTPHIDGSGQKQPFGYNHEEDSI